MGLEIFDTTIMDIRRNISRAGEIQLYLDEHSEVENYVILDDDIIDYPLSNKWVRCLFKEGLTTEKAIEAIEILGRKE